MELLIYDPAAELYEGLLRKAVDSNWEIHSAWNETAWLGQRLPKADAMLTTFLEPSWRDKARRLRAVFFPGAGVMHRSADELPPGCVLCNVYEHGDPMAEYVFCAMLRHATQMERHEAAFRRGEWSGSGRLAGETHEELGGKTIGLFGYGTIGQAVARRAEAFGMEVLVKTSTREDANFWQRSDYVVVACPLTEASRESVGEKELSALKTGAVLINVGRAEVVREEALYEALRRGRISAVLDTWYQYPSDSSERMHGSRLDFHLLPNVICTPHMSAWSGKLVERRMRQIAKNLDRLARGENLENVVLRNEG